MVAFTLLDGDSDGYITLTEFRELIAAALKAVAVCSKLAQGKVLHLGTNLRYHCYSYIPYHYFYYYYLLR